MDVVKIPGSLEATPSEPLQGFKCFIIPSFAHVPSRTLRYQVDLNTDDQRRDRGTTENDAPLCIVNSGGDFDTPESYTGDKP